MLCIVVPCNTLPTVDLPDLPDLPQALQLPWPSVEICFPMNDKIAILQECTREFPFDPSLWMLWCIWCTCTCTVTGSDNLRRWLSPGSLYNRVEAGKGGKAVKSFPPLLLQTSLKGSARDPESGGSLIHIYLDLERNSEIFLHLITFWIHFVLSLMLPGLSIPPSHS